MFSTHISVIMNVIMDTYVCTFRFWSLHSFVCNIIALHRNRPYRKHNFSHPLISGFLLPFFLESLVCLDLSRLSWGLLWRGRGPALQSTLALAALFAQLCTAAACPLTCSSSAGLVDCGYKEKIPNSDGFGWSHIGRSPVIPLLSPAGNVHLRKALSLYNGHRLCSSY